MKKTIAVILVFAGLFIIAFAGGFFYIRTAVKPKNSFPIRVADNERTINISPEISPQAQKIPVTGTPKITPAPQATQLSGKTVPLSITSPANNSSVTAARTTVKGITTPNSEVYINEAEDTADARGNFSATVSLDEGENIIIVSVVDPDGNTAEQELKVKYLI